MGIQGGDVPKRLGINAQSCSLASQVGLDRLSIAQVFAALCFTIDSDSLTSRNSPLP